jgi:hypothetical protein
MTDCAYANRFHVIAGGLDIVRSCAASGSMLKQAKWSQRRKMARKILTRGDVGGRNSVTVLGSKVSSARPEVSMLKSGLYLTTEHSVRTAQGTSESPLTRLIGLRCLGKYSLFVFIPGIIQHTHTHTTQHNTTQ